MENERLIYRAPDIRDIAGQFVDLARMYNWNDGRVEISKDEEGILFNVVTAAGFRTRDVVLGRLTIQDKFDVEGEEGEKRRVNTLCPFKVIDMEGGDLFFATGWLECVLCRVFWGNTERKKREESREELIEVVLGEIKRSIPLEPIMFTVEGDLLVEYPSQPHESGNFPFFVEHKRDKDRLGSCVGIHDGCDSCGGWVDFRKSSHVRICNEIICRKCRRNAVFSNEIRTYGGLRQQLDSNLILSQCMKNNSGI